MFTAKVTEEVFQGPLDRLVLETPSGSRLTVLVANESASLEAIHQGDQVHVGLHTDDLVIVRADSTTV